MRITASEIEAARQQLPTDDEDECGRMFSGWYCSLRREHPGDCFAFGVGEPETRRFCARDTSEVAA